jgi:cobalt/nickel transport protein
MSANPDMSSNYKFLFAGIAVALIISVLAPFLASSDPDGLESAAEGLIDEETFLQMEETAPVVDSPMPDYAIDGLGKSGEVFSIVFGTISVLGISFVLGKLTKA